MAWTSYFYDGSVAETPWSKAAIRVGRANYGVVGINDLKVTAAAGDRTVSIAGGDCWGKGVYDVHSGAETKALAAGTRYDLIVVHRDWNTNTTSIQVITGSSSRDVPTSRDIGYGTVDDQPLALVKVTAGSTVIGEIIDLRCWAGSGGGLVAREELVMKYLDEVGTSLMIQKSRWVYTVTSTGTGAWVNNWTSVVSPLSPTNWSSSGRITIDTSSGAKHVTGQIRLTRKTSTASFPFGGSYVPLGVVLPTTCRGSSDPRYLHALISGSGSWGVLDFFINPADGSASARGSMVNVSVGVGSNIYVNFDYYI